MTRVPEVEVAADPAGRTGTRGQALLDELDRPPPGVSVFARLFLVVFGVDRVAHVRATAGRCSAGVAAATRRPAGPWPGCLPVERSCLPHPSAWMRSGNARSGWRAGSAGTSAPCRPDRPSAPKAASRVIRAVRTDAMAAWRSVPVTTGRRVSRAGSAQMTRMMTTTAAAVMAAPSATGERSRARRPGAGCGVTDSGPLLVGKVAGDGIPIDGLGPTEELPFERRRLRHQLLDLRSDREQRQGQPERLEIGQPAIHVG